MLCEREELLFKVGASIIFCQNKEIFVQDKLQRMAQHTKIQVSLREW